MQTQQDPQDTSNYAHCLTMRNRHRKSHYVRCIITSILMLMNGYFHIITMPIRAGEGYLDAYHFGPLRAAGLLTGILAIAVSILFLILYWMADPEKPRMMFVDMLIFLAGALIGLFNPLICVAVAISFAFCLKDCKEGIWLKQQPGYPTFSVRLEEQTRNADYRGDHAINDTILEADTTFREGVTGDTLPDVPQMELTWKHSARAARLSTDVEATQDYEIIEGNSPDEMAGVAAENDLLPDAAEVKSVPLEVPMAALPDVDESILSAPAPALGEPPVTAGKTLPDITTGTQPAVKTLPDQTIVTPPAAPKKGKQLPPPVQTDIASARAWASEKPAFPEPSASSEIPDPKWDVPETKWDVPDPVMDTGAILSDIPDIAGDIPDLPEIPDIPEL